MILIMAQFLSENSFISKLLSLKINLSDIYFPFLIDSDSIQEIKLELQKTQAIRRFACQSCVKKNLKPHIWLVPPCCMPSSSLKCPTCNFTPKVIDHFSLDLMPPILKDGSQEPIFVKSLNDYPSYESYYNKEGFPYKRNVEIIDNFIKRRGLVEKGF